MELLDTIRGYGISVVIIALVIMGLLSHSRTKFSRYVSIFASIAGSAGSFSVAMVLLIVPGWDEFFSTRQQNASADYEGRHQLAARIIKSIGAMDVSFIGIIFLILGLLFSIFAFKTLKTDSK